MSDYKLTNRTINSSSVRDTQVHVQWAAKTIDSQLSCLRLEKRKTQDNQGWSIFLTLTPSITAIPPNRTVLHAIVDMFSLYSTFYPISRFSCQLKSCGEIPG